jgi:hypothetical protein
MANKNQVNAPINSLDSINSYITKKILDYVFASGCGSSEIAKMADVSRATIHNWMHGHEARYTNLARILSSIGLDNSFSEKIFNLTKLSKSFDAKDIKLYHSLVGELNKLSQAIEQNLKEVALERLVAPPEMSFISLFGRKLIERALSRKWEMSALLLPIGFVDASSENLIEDYEQFSFSLESDLEKSQFGFHVLDKFDSKSIKDLSNAGILAALTSDEKIFLNELLSKKVLVKYYQLEWGYGDTGNEFQLEWGYRDTGNEFQWFLEWLTDRDGQEVISTLFKDIRELTSQNKNKLELYVESVEGYLNKSKDKFLKTVYDNLSPEDQLSFYADEHLDDYECPIELYREDSSYIYEGYEIPISPALVKFFFNIMGFQAAFKCDEPPLESTKF